MEEEDVVKWDFAKSKPQDEAVHERMASRKSGGGGAADPAAIGHHGHARQFRDVLKAIKKGAAPLIDGPEGRRSVEIILAIYKSAETGAAVQLPLKSDPVLKARKRGVGG
jgi:predicted dehydrogenase